MKKLIIMIFLLSIFLMGCQLKTDAKSEDYLFQSGMLAIADQNLWGYMNNEGEVVIDFIFDQAGAFYHDTAIVKPQEQDLYQLIDKTGAFILDKGYSFLYRDQAMGHIIYKEDKRYGLMDQNGNKLTAAIYDFLLPFSDGLSLVRKNSLWGFIDDKGKVAIDIQYSVARRFSQGFTIVYDGLVNQCIDTKGKVIFDHDSSVGRFDKYGNVVVLTQVDGIYKQNLYNINKKRYILTEKEYIYGGGPMYAVKEDDGYFYIYLHDGTKLDETPYGAPYEYNKNYLSMQDHEQHDKFHYIFLDGNQYRTFEITDFHLFDWFTYQNKQRQIAYGLGIKNGLYMDLYVNGESYYLRADEIQEMTDDGVIIVRNERYGLVDFNGEILIDIIYHSLAYHQDGYYVYYNNQNIGFLNHKFEDTTWGEYEAYYPEWNIIEFPNVYPMM